MSFATFRAGKQIGDSWAWYADGSVSFYGFYKNGQEIAIKSFTSQQRPFHNWINDGTQRVGFSGERECDTANYNRAGIKK
jgi:antitoxin component YwqK of YwqJK toxin-antitoxin module